MSPSLLDRPSLSRYNKGVWEQANDTPWTAILTHSFCDAHVASAGLRSGPAAFKDPAPARSPTRSVPQSCRFVTCLDRRCYGWRVNLVRQKA